jgi:hypothetical protein
MMLAPPLELALVRETREPEVGVEARHEGGEGRSFEGPWVDEKLGHTIR